MTCTRDAACAADGVGQNQPCAEVDAFPQTVFEWPEKRHRLDQMGRQAGEEELALAERFSHKREVEHLLDVPRRRRFGEFPRIFDEGAYRRQLADGGYRWLGRGDGPAT